MKIGCASPGELGTLVRRCAAQQKSNGGCYECLLYPFCVPEHDYANAKKVEEMCEVKPAPALSLGEELLTPDATM